MSGRVSGATGARPERQPVALTLPPRLQGEEEEYEEEDASSTTTGDLAPRMREQFDNLSSALVETSENLHTFEFMLGQYRWDLSLIHI